MDTFADFVSFTLDTSGANGIMAHGTGTSRYFFGVRVDARVGMLRAMNHGVERVFNPDRKDTHWGKRKLKRDE
jgi:hypothetical protein